MMAKFEKIYVYCPANVITGGPDALHQLTYYLNLIGCNAELVYFTYSKKMDIAIPFPYKNYITSFRYEYEVQDSSLNAIIIPEFAGEKAKKFKKSRVFIWWLSVDNNRNRKNLFWKLFFFATLPARLIVNYNHYKSHFNEAIRVTLQTGPYSFNRERDNVEHLCASYYAYKYVRSNTQKNVHLCIEPISKFFLDDFKEWQNCHLNDIERSSEILYNPKKSSKFVKELEKYGANLKFFPLEGLNQKQLIEKYKSAKLYVDFGPFPGAERMPKEAVLFGCSVITGRNGASSVYEDVPIPESYKFESKLEEIPNIIKMINVVLEKFDQTKKDFDEYRLMVLNLEANFIKSLKEVFT